VGEQTGLRRFVRPVPGSAPSAAAPADAPVRPAAPTDAAPVTLAGSVTPGPVTLPGPATLPGLPGPQTGPGRSGPQAQAAEKCELCATPVPDEHGHVADIEAASLMCACRACYLLFTRPNAGRMKYVAVPDRYLADPGRVMTGAEWDQLEIPVGLAFFLRTSREGGELAGFYPSPAGVTECRLDLQLWQQLTGDYPLLAAPVPDVEAALISRSDSGVEYFLVPIDACYELAGRMRLYWRGFDGGTEARQSIAAFLAGVRSRARNFSQVAGQENGTLNPAKEHSHG
jgi:hypothetical protein